MSYDYTEEEIDEGELPRVPDEVRVNSNVDCLRKNQPSLDRIDDEESKNKPPDGIKIPLIDFDNSIETPKSSLVYGDHDPSNNVSLSWRSH